MEFSSYTQFWTNKTPESLAKSPHGKIPDGFKLFEGTAIAEYYGESIIMYRSLIEHCLLCRFILSRMVVAGRIPYSKPERTLGILNNHLSANTLRCCLRAVYRFYQLRCSSPHQIHRCCASPRDHCQLKEVFGETEYIEKLQSTPPAKEKKEKEPKEPKPSAAPKPKAKEAEEEDEPLVPAEPKVKTPWTTFLHPTSTLRTGRGRTLKTHPWQRRRSKASAEKVIPHITSLQQGVLRQGGLLFKYNNELAQTFMSSNQIVGQVNDSIIAGALISRGQDIQPVINVAPDWESYSYTKIDLADAAQKDFFEGALAWDLKIDGKEWVDGKNFK
ncbi:hypothetical protein BT96DRAFT_1025992 [Gymnopus androsaceus JB14]|uniref:EF-1-gamma C-terminal domain-containing protein n=1 Tax=Gymnopus androsaceus JB14 TaxID=1447944 RepID=A0A6A4GMR9_9AGAR|nr:hypothetical protein BT96DRAFT_1025992 [Gymnopus androsaceus JB14]